MKCVEKILPDGTRIKVYELSDEEQRAVYRGKSRWEYTVRSNMIPSTNQKQDPVSKGAPAFIRRNRDIKFRMEDEHEFSVPPDKGKLKND